MRWMAPVHRVRLGASFANRADVVHRMVSRWRWLAAAAVVGLFACTPEPGAGTPSPDAGRSGGDGGGTLHDAGGTTGDGGTFTGPLAAARKRCFELTNLLRTGAGGTALGRAADWEACVDDQARQESLIDTPHGKLGLCSEARQNHGDGTGYENIELINLILNEQFAEGPNGPHYRQWMDPQMKRVACGFYTRSDGNFWINVDFYP